MSDRNVNKIKPNNQIKLAPILEKIVTSGKSLKEQKKMYQELVLDAKVKTTKNYKQHMSYNKCWNCPHCKYDYFAKGGLLLKCSIYDDMIEVSECPIVNDRLNAAIQQGNHTFKKLTRALRKVL